MEIKYRQDINHNYMILGKNENVKAPLAEKMLLHNNIPGLLRMSVQHLNGKAYYFYDIRSRQSLNVLFEGRSMSFSEIRSLLSGLVKVADKLSDYLLRSTDILVKPQCIFWNLETQEPVFCCYPEAGDTYTEAYLELAQFIIDSTDKEDEDATKLAYDYFNQVCDGIYSPENILKRSMPREEEASVSIETYDEPLPPGSLWDDDEDSEVRPGDEGFFSENSEREDKQKKHDSSQLILYIIAALAVVTILAVFLQPGLPGLVGLKGVKPVSIGGVAAAVFAAAIVGLVYIKRRDKGKNEEAEADLDNCYERKGVDAAHDVIEQAEFSALDERKTAIENSGETVLLSDYFSADSLAGRKIRTEAARLTGNINGREAKFEIDKSPFTIGKMAGKADAVIADRRVSRIHAAIRKNGGKYFISDLNSTNGTCLNDRRLEQDEAAALEDGDIIKIANVMLQFSL